MNKLVHCLKVWIEEHLTVLITPFPPIGNMQTNKSHTSAVARYHHLDFADLEHVLFAEKSLLG